MVVRASWRPKSPSDDLNLTAGHPWDDQTYFPWTWVWLWEAFPPLLKCINLQNRWFPTLVSPLEKVIVVPESASQAILKGKECSKSPTIVQRNVCKVSHHWRGTFVQSRVQWQHLCTPHMVVDLTWKHGMEPHYLVVYFFCGVNLLKLGSVWKCIGLRYKIVIMCYL